MRWVRDRTVSQPPGYAERSCQLVSYRLPGLRHCFVLCHLQSGENMEPAELLPFFLTQAEEIARLHAGNAQAFLLVYNGLALRKRQPFHLHLFVIQHRWQRAWAYLVLALRSLRLLFGSPAR